MSVGYVPQSPRSRYQVGNNGPWFWHPMDLGSDPSAIVGGANSHDFLDFTAPGVREAFESRYGPNSSPPRRGGWQGPNNEYIPVIKEALIWRFGSVPSITEITDVQATNDTSIYWPYLEQTATVGSQAQPIPISDRSKPEGLWSRPNAALGFREWVFNTWPAPGPVDPPPPPPPPVDVDPPPAPRVIAPWPVIPPAWFVTLERSIAREKNEGQKKREDNQLAGLRDYERRRLLEGV